MNTFTCFLKKENQQYCSINVFVKSMANMQIGTLTCQLTVPWTC